MSLARGGIGRAWYLVTISAMSTQVILRYSQDALRQLKKLDKATAKRIVLKVGDNAIQPDPLSRAKALRGRLSGKYRYRVGEYRVIFMVDEKGCVTILVILGVAHRKDVYK